MGSESRQTAELIEGCIKRDTACWEEFISRYSNLIAASARRRLWACRISLPSQDIEDIRQSILSSVWERNLLEAVRNRDTIDRWLAVTSGNMAIEYIRKKRAELNPRSLSVYDTVSGDPELAGRLLSRSAADKAAMDEFAGRADQLIDALPDKEKLVIKLQVIYGKKLGEISEILRMPEGTITSYAKRAKDKLRKALKDYR